MLLRPNWKKQAKSEGMLTMLEDGIYKCAAGLTHH